MNVVSFVHEGLGNSSYMVGLPDNSAFLVDPDRSIERYLRVAADRDWRIETVFETHVHADFVTGAVEAAHRAGARVFAPAGAGLAYNHKPLSDAGRVPLEGAEIEAVASPGHTPEHVSYVLRQASRPPLLFSGGALIVGGAARTDLLAPDLTGPLTSSLFKTLRSAFSALPDDTSLLPTHGSGSFCSAGGGDQRTSTLGQERAQNPVLSFDDEEEFVRWFPSTFPAAPGYFFRMRAFNQGGPRLREQILPPDRLPAPVFDAARDSSTVIDLRPYRDYSRRHVPGSINIEFRPQYPVWLGWLVPHGAQLLFVPDDTRLERVLDETLLVGYERFAGVLEGGFPAWEQADREVAEIDLVNAVEAKRALLDGSVAVDVREQGEWDAGHLPGAVHVPLGDLQDELDLIPRDRPLVVYCGHGYRGSTGASLLERAGFQRIMNFDGGFTAWREAGLPVER
jgi:glyoxylase-like metal-dependent hydrolase (beta-lactamase superfamily II)